MLSVVWLNLAIIRFIHLNRILLLDSYPKGTANTHTEMFLVVMQLRTTYKLKKVLLHPIQILINSTNLDKYTLLVILTFFFTSESTYNSVINNFKIPLQYHTQDCVIHLDSGALFHQVLQQCTTPISLHLYSISTVIGEKSCRHAA